MNLLRRIIILIGLTLFVYSQNARADIYAGALLGPSFVGDGLGTQFIYGAHVDARLSQYFGIGVYATHQTLGSLGDNTLHETIVAGEFNVYPDLGFPVYFGVKAGLGLTRDSLASSGTLDDGSVLDRSSNNFAYGPATGFDLPFTENFSFGMELNGIFISIPNSVVHTVNLFFVGNYHF